MATEWFPYSIGEYQGGEYVVTGWKIKRYPGAGAACVHEGWPEGGAWATKEEAEGAAQRANAGDESGIRTASYWDD